MSALLRDPPQVIRRSRSEVKAALGDNMQKIEKLYIPQKSKKTEMLDGEPGEVAKKLVDRCATR